MRLRTRLIALLLLVASATIGALGVPSAAQAQVPTLSPDIMGYFGVREAQEKVEKGIWSGIVLSFFQTIEFFLQKQAYSVATYFASGGKGQSPLVIFESWSNFEDAALKDSAGHFLGSLTENWDLKKYGIDLCAPSTPGIRARITLDLFRQTIEPKAKCDWKQISENYEKFTSESQTDEFLAKSAVQFAPGQNDLSILAQTSQAVQAFSARETAAKIAEQERIRTKPVVDPVSGDVRATKEDVAKAGDIASPGEQTKQTTMSASQLASGPSLLAASKALGNFFINTLGSKLLDRLFKEGFPGVIKCFGAEWCPPEAQKEAAKAVATGEGAATYGRAQAELAFADLITPRIVQGGSIDFVSEFSTCPEEGRTPNNCTIDDSFSQAVRSADVGAPKTVSQALSEGLLHSQWQLLPASKDPDGKRDCYSRAYCEANLKKLRLARVLPVGFEIAARLSPVDKPWTMGQVIVGFSDCATDPATGKAVYDAAKPFCHLIDPNFLLKAPPARCTARVPGPILASPQGPNRANICVDAQTCTAQAANGACAGEGAWGYCLKEKNAWHLQADSCPAQFASCTSFTGRDGASASYLLSTVDYGACNADNAGCRAYATTQDNKATAWIAAPAIYLDKDAEDCASQDKGCTRLVRASSTPQGFEGDEVFLKVAPEYLQCAGGGAWPATVAKLNEVVANQSSDQKKACSDYAPVCAQSEVGCERFTPVDGDPAVPAKLASNGSDLCPAECVGYQTFKQVASSFEGERFPLYFIPSTAGQCTAADVGCEQFTNLDELARGGEAVAHFKAVRHCITPTDETKYATFFTWEGSDTAGYQLRAFTLMKSNQKDGATPCTKIVYNATGVVSCADTLTGADDTAGTPNDPSDDCSAATYKENPDCRQFYSQNPTIAGATVQITYRFFSKTVSVTEDCHPFRKTLRDTPITEKENCEKSGGFWNAEQGACIYSAAPSESQSCSAPVAGCRAYTGNAGNNTVTKFFSSFENGADGWIGGIISAESTALNGHSFKIEKGGTASRASTVTAGRAYFLSFWAKGAGTITATMEKIGHGSWVQTFSPTSTLSSGWQQYSLGPLIASEAAEANITFSGFTATSFLDNVLLKEAEENLTVIRDSWNTPLTCDANPTDALPGVALGCEAYKDRQGDAWNIRSFSQVCREQAIGCELFTDTKNTAATNKTLYNLSCGVSTQPVAEPKPCTLADAQTPVCTVAQGQKSCRFNAEEIRAGQTSSLRVGDKTLCTYAGEIDDSYFDGGTFTVTCTENTLKNFRVDSSTLRVPADATVALVNSPQFSCAAENASCSALGLKTYNAATKNTSYATVYKKNNPDAYDAILCDADAEGCDAWSAGASQYYFKDPKATGALCEWKDSATFVSITTGEQAKGNGWARQGIGACKSSPGGTYAKQCASDADCDQSKSETCDKGVAVRCDGTSLGFPAGILTQGNKPAYENNGSFTGVCIAQWNACTELRDPADTTEAHPQGTPYFVLKNQKFQGLLNDPSCAAGASLYKGCALMDDTSNPAKQWSAEATYAKSDAQGGALVAPFSGESKAFGMCYGNKKTKIGNFEISVPYVKGSCVSNADCGAAPPNVTGWHCETSSLLNNANTLLKVRRDRSCEEWLSCKTSEEVFDKGLGSTRHVCTQLGVCTEATSGASAVGPCAKWKEPDTAFFDEKQYAGRDTSWFGDEYSGYTIPNQYPIAALTTQSAGEDKPATLVFAEEVQNQPTKYYRPDGAPIALASDGLDLSCRGYSELDAPFPATIAAEKTPYGAPKKPAPGFENANICHSYIDLNSNGVKDPSDPEQNCECNYTKAKYKGGETQYFTAYAPTPPGVCGGGFTADGESKDGKSCARSLECRDERKLKAGENAEDGACNALDDADTFRGWEGYCLERDFATPINKTAGQYACLTWLPLELAGGTDVYNLYASAGYVPPPGSGQLYCLEGKGNAGRGIVSEKPLDLGTNRTPIRGSQGYRALMVAGDIDASFTCTFNDGQKCGIVPTVGIEATDYLFWKEIQDYGALNGHTCQFAMSDNKVLKQETCRIESDKLKEADALCKFSNIPPDTFTSTKSCSISLKDPHHSGVWPAKFDPNKRYTGNVKYPSSAIPIHHSEIERIGVWITMMDIFKDGSKENIITDKELLIGRAALSGVPVLADVVAWSGLDSNDPRVTPWKNLILKIREGNEKEGVRWDSFNWDAFNPFSAATDCNATGALDDEYAAVRLRFDNQGYYEGYDWVACIEDDGSTIESSLYMYFREVCSAVARVAETSSVPVPKNKAHTNALWSVQPLQITSSTALAPLHYEMLTPWQPFSSAHTLTTESPLFGFADLVGSAGNPWSCRDNGVSKPSGNGWTGFTGGQCGASLYTCNGGPNKDRICVSDADCIDTSLAGLKNICSTKYGVCYSQASGSFDPQLQFCFSDDDCTDRVFADVAYTTCYLYDSATKEPKVCQTDEGTLPVYGLSGSNAVYGTIPCNDPDPATSNHSATCAFRFLPAPYTEAPACKSLGEAVGAFKYVCHDKDGNVPHLNGVVLADAFCDPTNPTNCTQPYTVCSYKKLDLKNSFLGEFSPSQFSGTGRCTVGQNKLGSCADDNQCKQIHECVENSEQRGGTCVGGKNNGQFCGTNADCPSMTMVSAGGTTLIDEGVCVGMSFTSNTFFPGANPPDFSLVGSYNSASSPHNSLQHATKLLQNLFARVFDVLVLKPMSFVDRKSFALAPMYTAPATPIPNLDRAYEPTTAVPPRITPAIAIGTKSVIPNINNATDFDGVAITGKADGLLISAKLFSADLSFFAWADKDQMPITRVAIDWDDGGNVLTLSGLYQNRKPFCSTGSSKEGAAAVCLNHDNLTCTTNEECPQGDLCALQVCSLTTTSVCTKNSDCPQGESCIDSDKGFHFGNSPEACSTQPFSFTHTYTYPELKNGGTDELKNQCQTLAAHQNGGRLTPTEAATLKFAHGVKDTDKVCVFIPKVQVKDNWGWCNGSKDLSGNDPGKWDMGYEGYYEEKKDPTDPTGKKVIDECDPQNNDFSHWTPFKGKMILLP